ncbi:MAG TPA: hypothetical protein VGW38_01810, partial [Chloroflexota bacterium]|nr:hypothetical protein [Chloroflexota bacterium]
MSPSLVIRRQRLLAQLHGLIHRRLTMVVAPAGYGKTTLLVDLEQECLAADLPLSLCWYAAAPWDNDPMLALGSIVAALRQRFAAFGGQTLRLLEEARTGTSPASTTQVIDSVVGVMVREAHEYIRDYTLLVVDDYHLLDVTASTRRAIELLLDRLPEHIHLVLLSRVVPALDTTRLVLTENIGALGPRDLAFTSEEIEWFLRQRYAVEPTPDVVEELHRRTEGWIAGLVLAMPAPVEKTPAARKAAVLSTLTADWSGGDRLTEY